ncbi:DUF1192 domain-containing protein [Pannonibacter sp. SL95]|uniref:DUF1192 domain-containing protein n=1 Tax=Pannonibacter sp. SL95 TaxID=2995153 RepID=UPI002275A393|nr:DUF1192 domain-containing protein [Pannonibacter sp. SL95]MCY1704824.1 DUF1192 domain-containing protein [Pannonibacter sp. SL95]
MEDLEPRQSLSTERPRAGDDLARLSETELTERIEIFTAEIARLRSELERRGGVRSAAEALFSKKSS